MDDVGRGSHDGAIRLAPPKLVRLRGFWIVAVSFLALVVPATFGQSALAATGAGCDAPLIETRTLLFRATPSRFISPHDLAPGPDGRLWVLGKHEIGVLGSDGVVVGTELPLAVEHADLVAGPDGAMWFSAFGAHSIVRVGTDLVVQQFSLPDAATEALALTDGPDGALWVTTQNQRGEFAVLRMTVDGTMTMVRRLPGLSGDIVPVFRTSTARHDRRHRLSGPRAPPGVDIFCAHVRG